MEPTSPPNRGGADMPPQSPVVRESDDEVFMPVVLTCSPFDAISSLFPTETLAEMDIATPKLHARKVDVSAAAASEGAWATEKQEGGARQISGKAVKTPIAKGTSTPCSISSLQFQNRQTMNGSQGLIDFDTFIDPFASPIPNRTCQNLYSTPQTISKMPRARVESIVMNPPTGSQPTSLKCLEGFPSIASLRSVSQQFKTLLPSNCTSKAFPDRTVKRPRPPVLEITRSNTDAFKPPAMRHAPAVRRDSGSTRMPASVPAVKRGTQRNPGLRASSGAGPAESLTSTTACDPNGSGNSNPLPSSLASGTARNRAPSHLGGFEHPVNRLIPTTEHQPRSTTSSAAEPLAKRIMLETTCNLDPHTVGLCVPPEAMRGHGPKAENLPNPPASFGTSSTLHGPEQSTDSAFEPYMKPPAALDGTGSTEIEPRSTKPMRSAASSTSLPAWSETSFPCSCSRSGCLKRYCTCFAAQRHCSNDCDCTRCSNKAGCHHRKAWSAAYEKIYADSAYRTLPIITRCRCHGTTSCLKGYCDCFSAGKTCGGACLCRNCENK